MLHRPKLLILDEPFSGLDARSSAILKELFQIHIKSGGSILFSTHIMEQAQILCTRIAKDGDITGAYHCRAEFYLPGYGWVPVDPSDVAKLMLKEDLEIEDPKVVEARDYYFGAQTETYIDLSTGRDIILNPEQGAGPLNYFMYPYAEVDGEPLDFISQEYLKYIVTFKEK